MVLHPQRKDPAIARKEVLVPTEAGKKEGKRERGRAPSIEKSNLRLRGKKRKRNTRGKFPIT